MEGGRGGGNLEEEEEKEEEEGEKRAYFSCVILCFGGDCYATKDRSIGLLGDRSWPSNKKTLNRLYFLEISLPYP